MLARTITMILLALAVTTAAQEEHDSRYIYVLANVVLDSESDMFFGTASGGTAIEPGDYANFVIWGGHGTSGIRVGGIVNSEDSLRVEIPVSFTVIQQAREMLLYGRAWLMHLSDTANIAQGNRISIRQPIRFDEPVLVRLGRLPDGVGISLNVTISRERITAQCERTQPIQVVTIQYRDGKVRSTHAAGRQATANPAPVRTWFSVPIDDAASQVLEYEAGIRFSKDPDSLLKTRTADLEVTRTYRIDTLHYQLEEITPDVTYTSTYSRRVELEPGVELRVVIPPDTPSVHGFNIEDTLIIVPPK